MRPSWSDIRALLLAWATARSGIDTVGGARWADEPPEVAHGPTVELSVLGTVRRGTDETVYDDDDDVVVPTTGGHRELVLQVAIDSDDQTLDASSVAIAERFATLATGPVSLAQLESVGLGLLSVGDAVTYSVRDAGGRAHPRSVLEVRLSFVSAVEDDAIPFIESAHATGTVTRPGATAITVPVAVTS